MSVTLAYLAGLFDGEGCIGHWNQGRQGMPAFRLQLNMTDRALVELFQTELGGRVVFKPRQKPHWKDQWRWTVNGEQAWVAYYKLEPYLRLKRWSAEPRK